MSQPFLPPPLQRAGAEGLRLGKYTLIRPLGSGGMAQVFLAHKPILDTVKVCALKMSIDLVGADEALRDSLLNEIRIASMLTHSNIVQVFDAGIVHGILYIELERIDGMDLSVLLESMADRQTEMSVEMAIYIVRAVLEGLHYAHTFAAAGVQQGIIHRDLSPHNVLISASGEVKIMDFGIGKTAHDHTSNRHIKGKVRYMAPEHAEGKAGAQADLFAVGAILFEMLEGRPFRERGQQHAMLATAATKPAPQLERDDIAPLIVTFYQRMTARSLEDRFANAAEALRFLGLWRGGEIHAQDMRTFYERQLDRGRHSGYTRGSISVPESFFRLVEAIKSVNPEQDARARPPESDARAGLEREQQRAIADVREAARRPVVDERAAGREADAPSIVRRSSGLGGPARAEPIAASTTIDAPPLHLRPRAPAPRPADGPAPLLGPAGTVRLNADGRPLSEAPSTPDADIPRAAHHHRPSSATPPAWDPSAATPRPSQPHADATFAVATSHGRRRRAVLVLAAVLSVVFGIGVGWALVGDTHAPSTSIVSERGAELAPTPAGEVERIADAEEPVLEPVVPIAAAPTIEAAAVADTPAEPPSPARTEAAPEAPIPAPASTRPSAVTPVKRPPKKPPAKKPTIEVRLAPNFIDGEVKIGKRTWTVTSTFDVMIPAGRYALAWRHLGDTAWQPSGEIVLSSGLRYLLRVGPKSLAVSSSPANGASE